MWKKIKENPLLKKIYGLWMKFARALGWVNTRILLFIIYWVIFTPARMVLLVLGKDLLNRRIDKEASSYWLEGTQASDVKQYLKQF